MKEHIVEVCCQCGLVHRWFNTRPTLSHHYHWGDSTTEALLPVWVDTEEGRVLCHARFHRTICARHLGGPNWYRMWQDQRTYLLDKYRVEGSLNAPLLAKGKGVSRILLGECENKYLKMAAQFGCRIASQSTQTSSDEPVIANQ